MGNLAGNIDGKFGRKYWQEILAGNTLAHLWQFRIGGFTFGNEIIVITTFTTNSPPALLQLTHAQWRRRLLSTAVHAEDIKVTE